MNIPPAVGQPFKPPEAITNGINNVGEAVNSIKDNLSSSINQFSQQAQAGVGASTQFLQSNTININIHISNILENKILQLISPEYSR